VITKVTFNERGLKIAEYPPVRLPTLPGGWDGIAVSSYPTTYSGFDVLNRFDSDKLVYRFNSDRNTFVELRQRPGVRGSLCMEPLLQLAVRCR
jgi:hypothetical protein